MTPPRGTLVIGAGMAGARAAEVLALRGCPVTVLEARERTGGRGFLRSFKGTDELLEFGGAWITPWQSRMRDACKRHDVALRRRHAVTARRWWRDGALHTDGPVSTPDFAAHERALMAIRRDSMALKAGDASFPQSFADYLSALCGAPVFMPKATRDLCLAWWSVSGNGDPDRVAASEFLSSCAYGGGRPDGMIDVWTDTIVGGVTQLCERMLRAPGIDLVGQSTVVELRHGDHALEARLADGRVFKADAAVLATGINPLGDIVFVPPLDGVKRSALATGHLGRSVKVWVRAKGLRPGTLATGDADGFNWMFVERETGDGDQYVVCFGMAHPDFDPGDERRVASVFRRVFPEGQFIASDWHDWIGDPYSKGTWVAPPLGQESGFLSKNWERFGAIAFASSDIAAEGAGWFEAALLSGEEAAQAIWEYLQGAWAS